MGERSAEIKPSSIPAAPSNNVTVSAPSVAPVVVTSKLSTSGLLESSSLGLFGDVDDGAGVGEMNEKWDDALILLIIFAEPTSTIVVVSRASWCVVLEDKNASKFANTVPKIDTIRILAVFDIC